MAFYDIIVIGGGPAGLSAVLRADKSGKKTLLIEREGRLGGILKQCIHDGFGVIRFGEKLSGPEYAERFTALLKSSNVQVSLWSFVTDIQHKAEDGFTVTYLCRDGVKQAQCKKIILATGCRERTRNQIFVQGDRGAGVFTAGTAQNLVNLEGVMPGRKCVILGSGDIGLIMARRLTLEGATVEGVYEAKSTPSGLPRNIHQCLEDFNIPLHLSTTVTRVLGDRRVEAVEICQVDGQMRPVKGTERIVYCDCLILAVGLIPENEIATALGVQLDKRTKGPLVDQNLETMRTGIFCCGNALHVNDLVDYVSESGETAADGSCSERSGRCLIDIVADKAFSYNVPQKININDRRDKTILYFRSADIVTDKKVAVYVDGNCVFSKKFLHLSPPEMQRITVDFSSATSRKSRIELRMED